MINLRCLLAVLLLVMVKITHTRDFYMGMFVRDDFLVAEDYVYKERVPYRFAKAKYGRVFKCPITYFRVADRLNMGSGPKVQILRGGLQKTLIVVRITSAYNQPVNVNVYVGCHNPQKIRTTSEDPGLLDNGTGNDTEGNDTNGTGGGGAEGGGAEGGDKPAAGDPPKT